MSSASAYGKRSYPAKRRARSTRISRSTRAFPGGGTACRMRITRPSAVVTVPSSSSCSEPARTTSAWRAVSDMKKSMTQKNSSLSRAARVYSASGRETSGL